MRRSLAALALIVLMSTACTASHPGTIALTWGRPLPGVNFHGGPAVLVSPTRLAFTTAGSGTCPELPTSLVVLNPTTIRMSVATYVPPGSGCTLDQSTTTVEVAIDPSIIDVSQTLTIQLADKDGKIYATQVAPGLS